MGILFILQAFPHPPLTLKIVLSACLFLLFSLCELVVPTNRALTAKIFLKIDVSPTKQYPSLVSITLVDILQKLTADSVSPRRKTSRNAFWRKSDLDISFTPVDYHPSPPLRWVVR